VRTPGTTTPQGTPISAAMATAIDAVQVFGGNGYTVIDRRAIAKQDIHHENIWGVADEDLFDLALREIDARAADGKRVFAHVMTTSNHRPFTYPEGRIDIPSRMPTGQRFLKFWASSTTRQSQPRSSQ
jgi:hypothetical protein